MTDHEIVSDYKAAKDKQAIIGILADQHVSSKDDAGISKWL